MSDARDATASPRRVEKPWGWELVWAETDAYVGKLLFVRAGESLSLQYHEVKDESWLVQEGRARLELGEVGGELESVEIGPGDAFHLPAGHRSSRRRRSRTRSSSRCRRPTWTTSCASRTAYGREGTSAP